MERPARFEHTRYLGDKRTQLVCDVDEWDPEHAELVVSPGAGHRLRHDPRAVAILLGWHDRVRERASIR